MRKKTTHSNAEVAQVFKAYPSSVRRRLLDLRELIFDTAASTKGVGNIEETLKWGEPAYITAESGSGSTIRIGWKPARPDKYVMYFNCKTSLVESFKTLFPGDFRFEGKRAIVFDEADEVPIDSLTLCIGLALTYHRTKLKPRLRRTSQLAQAQSRVAQTRR